MTALPPKGDLLALVADLDMEAALRGIISRHKSLGIRRVRLEEDGVRRHPQRDNGCCTDGVDYLRPFAEQYQRVLLMFDHDGSGRTRTPAVELEREIENDLNAAGWRDRAAVIVLEPELEAWVWSDSPHVEREMGWMGREPLLRVWLTQKGFLRQGDVKPMQPKQALEETLRAAHKPRSPALYQALAEKVSLARCSDRSFVKFRNTLRKWFAAGPAPLHPK